MNRDVCEHFNPVDLPCEKCSVQKSTLREAATQALEALEWFNKYGSEEHGPSLRGAEGHLRAALAEPVQEPVAWIHTDPDKPRVKFLEWRENEPGYRGDWIKTPLYTTPQRKPLTEEDRAVERAHGIGGQP